MATSTPAHAFKGMAPQGVAPGPFAFAAAPLIVLTRDERLLATLRKISEPVHAVRAVGSEIDFSAGLLAHTSGVAVLDSAAIASSIGQLTARLHAQFPELVLIVAGSADAQAALAAQITDGSVHRFLHKPVSEQRVRLFVEAAWRRHEEAQSGRSAAAAAAATPARPRRPKWWLTAAALAGLAVALAWLLTRPAAPPLHATRTPAAAAPASAADDAALEDLLLRADHALASGALVAPPPGENAADLYREALRRNARDPRAVNGLEQVIDRLLGDAEAQLQDHHLDAAQQLADAARAISPSHPRVAFLAAQIGAQRERAVLGKAQRAAASGDVAAALAVLDDASRGGERRSSLVDEARQQLAQKQVDARVADYLARARDAFANGQIIEPTEQNANFFVASARALAPKDPAVLQANQELITRLQAEAHQAITAGNADQADILAGAAADAGADPAEIAAVHAAAQQLRGSARADSVARLETLFNQRMTQGRLVEPPTDSARYYLQQLAQAEPASESTLTARTAFETRLIAEARKALDARDYAGARHWVGEARTLGASPTALAAVESELAAAQDTPKVPPAAAPPAASYVSASTLARTRYVQPEFPSAARLHNIEGWVDLQFLVRTDGSLGDVTIVGAEPVGVFEQAALDAVRRWRYQPVMRDGAAVEQRTRMRVRFAVKP